MAARESRVTMVRSVLVLGAFVGAVACAGAHGSPGGAPGAGGISPAKPQGVARRTAIELPDLLAIELPSRDRTSIGPDEPPLRELLAAPRSDLQVTHNLTRPIGAGATDVTWTAWEGTPGQSAARETRTARIHVFPFGQTPVGLTADDRSTAGNQSPKIVRDNAGKAHMVWLDSGRPGRGSRLMYRRAAVDATTGAVSWETEAVRVASEGNEIWNSYPVIAASNSAIHIAWAGGPTVRYRRLVRSGTDWTFEPIRDTRVEGPGEDWAPGLATRGDNEIHILSPTVQGRYAISTDAGKTWTGERVPLPPPAQLRIKAPALALDPWGNSHITFTKLVRSPPGQWKYGGRHGAYWELRYIRRRAGGGWEDAQNVLAAFPGWTDPGNRDDVLVDFSHVGVDRQGTLHVAWHGTVNTRSYGEDEAFYLRRPVSGQGTWGAWEKPEPLHPIDRSGGDYFSYAPSLALDEPSGVVFASVFFDTVPAVAGRYDVSLRVLRDGKVQGPAIRITRAARDAAAAGSKDTWSTWFPCAASRVYRAADGRAWVDLLGTVVTSPDLHHIVYQRVDVTALVRPQP